MSEREVSGGSSEWQQSMNRDHCHLADQGPSIPEEKAHQLAKPPAKTSGACASKSDANYERLMLHDLVHYSIEPQDKGGKPKRTWQQSFCEYLALVVSTSDKPKLRKNIEACPEDMYLLEAGKVGEPDYKYPKNELLRIIDFGPQSCSMNSTQIIHENISLSQGGGNPVEQDFSDSHTQSCSGNHTPNDPFKEQCAPTAEQKAVLLDYSQSIHRRFLEIPKPLIPFGEHKWKERLEEYFQCMPDKSVIAFNADIWKHQESSQDMYFIPGIRSFEEGLEFPTDEVKAIVIWRLHSPYKYQSPQGRGTRAYYKVSEAARHNPHKLVPYSETDEWKTSFLNYLEVVIDESGFRKLRKDIQNWKGRWFPLEATFGGPQFHYPKQELLKIMNDIKKQKKEESASARIQSEECTSVQAATTTSNAVQCTGILTTTMDKSNIDLPNHTCSTHVIEEPDSVSCTEEDRLNTEDASRRYPSTSESDVVNTRIQATSGDTNDKEIQPGTSDEISDPGDETRVAQINSKKMLQNQKRKWTSSSDSQEFNQEEENEEMLTRSESTRKKPMLEEAGQSTGNTHTETSARRSQDLSDPSDDEQGMKPLNPIDASTSESNESSESGSSENEDEPKKFRCTKCGNVYSSNRNLMDHESREHEKFFQQCPKCKLKFTQKSKWNTHEKSDKCGKKYICDCGKEFDTYAGLDYHRRKVHGYKPKSSGKTRTV